jgi:hypothetical protein
MLSTKTIILIVVGLVILFFIYNSKKKCVGYSGTTTMTTYTSKKNIDITKEVSEIERKLRVVDPFINVNVEVYGGRNKPLFRVIDPNFRLTFTTISSSKVKMLDVMKNQQNNVSGILKLKDIDRNQVGDLIDISADLNAIINNNKPDRIKFTMDFVRGGFDKLNIIVN